MIYRSKAPLRIGLAGGGTDVSPYSDEFGGAILNTTISLNAYASIEPTTLVVLFYKHWIEKKKNNIPY
jgi:D-glycero-alpha-D-manno-heptose-7-phosphate kinase